MPCVCVRALRLLVFTPVASLAPVCVPAFVVRCTVRYLHCRNLHDSTMFGISQVQQAVEPGCSICCLYVFFMWVVCVSFLLHRNKLFYFVGSRLQEITTITNPPDELRTKKKKACVNNDVDVQ